MINRFIIQNIYNDILELSSTEIQIKKWITGETGNISSYIELMCRLFDDDGLDEFIERDAFLLGFPDALIKELSMLRIMLNEFEGEGLTSREIIASEEWKKISEKASTIIKLWPKSK
jgi:hypothetical protein